MPIINVLRNWDPKRPRGARNCESFPSKRECTKDEKETMLLEAKISLRRRMTQDMLITTLIITSGLKVTGENISRQIAEVVKLEWEVTNPQIEISLIVTQTRLRRLDS